jgi:UDP-N-acetylglucosamine 2-epimerase
VPGILTDKQTEWVETVKEGWNVQAGPNAEKIVDAYHNFKTPGFRSNVLGDGSAAHKTASILHQLLNP